MLRFGTLMFLMLAACAAGCTSSTTATTVSGDTVTNTGGVGTGSVAGVSIEVRGLTTGEATVMPSVQTLAGPSGNYSRELWNITLGDVKIVFERFAEGPIELTVNENFYGTIEPGDAVLVDENRTVFVNEVERTTTARDFRDPVPARPADAAAAGD